jgi:methionyl-tRNA formyltransferase
MSIVIASSYSSNINQLLLLLKTTIYEEIIVIKRKEDLTLENLTNINPRYVFFPHWSYFIPSEIHLNFNCIVFHMTDLPYGRGGSPLQNLIVRGHKTTKVSAIKVVEGIDEGPIYLKKELSLEGAANEIFKRCIPIVQSMIIEIISQALVPIQQEGEIVNFQRRKPCQSDIRELDSLEDIYNYIRMLDAKGYPNAYIENQKIKFNFSRVKKTKNNELVAYVRISKK